MSALSFRYLAFVQTPSPLRLRSSEHSVLTVEAS
jgi:hypothetical protein